jgi:hypothetical protein
MFAGNITELQLEKKIEEWVEKKTGGSIEFDSSEAIKLLKEFGILSISKEKLNVLSNGPPFLRNSLYHNLLLGLPPFSGQPLIVVVVAGYASIKMLCWSFDE